MIALIRSLCTATALLIAGAVAAQTTPAPSPAPSAIEPPGRGMIADPCPPIDMPERPLAEPGQPAPITRDYGAKFAAIMSYQKRYDWPWLCRYQADNQALKAGPAPRVVFMGDSITEAWGRYDRDLFGKGVIDRGISGQTSPQMLVRFYQDVVALHPRVVHIMAGTNDVAGNSGPTSPDQYKAMIRAMVDLARANHIRVVLGSILPSNRFPWVTGLRPAEQIVALNAWLKAYAAERGLVYADYHAALADAEGGMKEGTSLDGVHPGTAGYRVMRPIAERAIAAAERQR